MAESTQSIKSEGEKKPFEGFGFWAVAIFLVIVWGTAFNMVDVGVRYMSPIWLVAFRTLLAAILILGYAYYKGLRLPRLSDRRWLWYIVLGTSGMTLPFFLISWAQETIDSGISAILVGIMPLITIFLAHYFTSEKLSWRKVIGFCIGLVGTIILFLPENFSVGLISAWKAQLLAVGAAFCYGSTTVGIKRAPETHSVVAAALMTICAAFTALIAALFSGPIPINIEPLGWWMVLGLAIGSTGIATIVFLQVIDRNGPTALAKINYFPPFVSVLVGIWWLGEPFTPRIAIAFGTIMLGVWIARNKVAKQPSC